MRAITKFLMCTMMSSNVSTDEVALIDEENSYRGKNKFGHSFYIQLRLQGNMILFINSKCWYVSCGKSVECYVRHIEASMTRTRVIPLHGKSLMK